MKRSSHDNNERRIHGTVMLHIGSQHNQVFLFIPFSLLSCFEKKNRIKLKSSSCRAYVCV
jgi:hypothetical protein